MTKDDVYGAVTDRIIAALESGTVPWRKPWSTRGGPVSLSTGKPYRGINIFLLGLQGYGDPRWGTYRAIANAGGQVSRGEKGTHIILWKPARFTPKPGDDGEDSDERSYLLLRQYVVFNAEQADGLPELPPLTEHEHTPIQRADAIVDGWTSGPPIMHGYDGASYSPSADLVRMPDPDAFDSSEDYYATLFHELTHATGHESRLARLEPALFGTDPYAREELVAELGSAMLSGLAGLAIAAGENSAAYIAGWLQRLKDDRKLVVNAAAAAQRAADLIVGTTFDDAELPEPVAAGSVLVGSRGA